MTGYSKTPLNRKIGFKSGHRWSSIAAFNGFEKLLAPLPKGVKKTDEQLDLNILIWCCNDLAILEEKMPEYMKKIHKSGMIWVLWYKKASRKQRDVNEDVIRDSALALGLVDVKVCAVNNEWSGLKLVYRLENR